MGARQREISVSGVLHQEPPSARLRQPAQGAPHLREGSGRQRARRGRGGRHPARGRRHAGGRAEQRRRAAAGQPGDALPGHRHRQRPGIVRQQIPPIFAKLLYGSKFHRLRMSRGPAGHRHLRRRHVRPAHHRQAGADHLAHRARGRRRTTSRCRSTPRRTSRGSSRARRSTGSTARGTQVTLEIEGRYQKGRASVDEFLEQVAIANPHVTLVYHTPEGETREFPRTIEELPPQPREIKPHPYGIEFGMLLRDAPRHAEPLARRLPRRRLQPRLAARSPRRSARPPSCRRDAQAAQHSRRARRRRSTRRIQATKIMAPPSNCHLAHRREGDPPRASTSRSRASSTPR